MKRPPRRPPRRLPLFPILGILACSALLIALAAFGGCGGDYVAAGKDAFLRGEFDDAALYLRPAFDQDRSNHEVRFLLGASLLQIGRKGEGEALLLPLFAEPGYADRALRIIVRVFLRGAPPDLADARRVLETARSGKTAPETLEAMKGRILAAQYEVAQTAIDAFMDKQLGAGGSSRVRRYVDALLGAKQDEFDAQFVKQAEALQRDYAFSDRNGLLERIQAARDVQAEMYVVLRSVVATDRLAYDARIVLAELSRLRGEYAEVLHLVEETLRLKPEDFGAKERAIGLRTRQLEASQLVARAMESGKRYADGIRLLEAARKFVPRPQDLDDPLARLYYLAQDLPKLETLASEWLERDPSSALASFYKGWVLFRRDLYTQALPYLDKAVGRSSLSAMFNQALGMNLVRLGNFQRAISHLEIARGQNPWDADLLIETAAALEGGGEIDRARLLLKDGISRFRNPASPEHRKVMDRLKEAYQRSGHSLDSLEDARRAHLIEPQNPFVCLRLAQLEADAGEVEHAARLCADVQRLMPEMTEAWAIGARIALQRDNPRQAIAMLAKVEELNPLDPVTPWVQAQALLAMKKYDEAREQARTALQRDAKQAGAALLLLEIEVARKDWDAAVAVGRTLIKDYPGDVAIHRRLAEALAAKKDWAEAAGHLGEASRLAPKDVGLKAELGTALIRAGKREEAVAALSAALNDAGDDPEILRTAAGGLYEAKEFVTAAAAYESLVAKLDRGDERNRALAVLARCRHYAGDRLGFLDTVLELRGLRQDEIAAGLFISHATFAGAYHEAAAAADVAEAQKPLNPDALRGAAKARLLVGQPDKAAQSAKTLEDSKSLVGEALVIQIRAHLALRQAEKIGPLLDKLLVAGPPAEIAAAHQAILRHHLDARNAAAALAHLDLAVPACPKDSEVHRLGGLAALLAGDLDRATALLESALRHDPRNARAAAALAATQIARDRHQEARAAIAEARGKEAAAIRDTVTVLAGAGDPPARTFTRFLQLLRARKFDEAAKAAAEAEDVPLTLELALADLARRTARAPEGAGLIAEALGRAHVFALAGVLEDRADQELQAAAARSTAEAPFLHLFRAWIRLRFGSPMPAAQVSTALIDQAGQTPFIAFVHASAALQNGGPENVATVIQRLHAGDVPRELARDIAGELEFRAERGLADRTKSLRTAEEILARIGKPDPSDIALRVQLADARDEAALAAEIATTLPESWKSRPRTALLLALQAARLGPTPETKAGLIAILDDDKAAAAIDPVRLAEAAVLADQPDRVAGIANLALRSLPYDAFTLARLLAVCKDRRELLGLRERLEIALLLVDPKSTLRAKPRSARRTLE